MLYLALSYLLISLICLLTGIVLYEALHFRKTSSAPPDGKPLVVYMITGLIVLTGIGQWVVLVLPLSIFVPVVLLLIIMIAALFLRKRVVNRFGFLWNEFKNQPAVCLVGLALVSSMILVLNAGPAIMDDTDSYHVQMIKWVQEYGTVPGLANLHGRFGFNSSWFIAIGMLSPKMGSINHYLVLNGVVSFWLCQYLFEKMSAALTDPAAAYSGNKITGIMVLLLLAVITWPMLRGNATSANYDFITCCCILVLFMETCFSKNANLLPEWVIWPCFLFTIRMINYPLLLLVVIALWQVYRKRHFRQLGWYMIAGILLMAPFIARNILLSGYPFFPVYGIDPFGVDWKADKTVIANMVEFIQYYNRVNTGIQSIEETRQLAFPQWIPQWFHYLFRYDKPVVVLGLLSVAFCLLQWNRIRKRFTIHAQLFTGVILLQLLSWFFLSPDPRFAYGPFLCCIFMVSMLFRNLSLAIQIKRILTATIILIFSGCFIYTVRKSVMEPHYRHWCVPRKLPVPPVHTILVDGITVSIPGKIGPNWNARCYGTPLPCLYFADPRLRARGKTVAEGFYIDNTIVVSFEKGFWY